MIELLPKPNHLLLALLYLFFFLPNINGSRQIDNINTYNSNLKHNYSIISLMARENSELREQRIALGFGLLLAILGCSGVVMIHLKRVQQKKKLNLSRLHQLEQELNFRKQEATSLAMLLTRNKQVMQQLSSSLKKAQRGVLQDGQLKVAIHHMGQELKKGNEAVEVTDMLNDIHQDFYFKLSTQCPDLTSNELKMLGLVRMGLSTKEIASLKNTSPKAVEMSRYRVRKKLNLSQNNYLSDYLLQLG